MIFNPRRYAMFFLIFEIITLVLAVIVRPYWDSDVVVIMALLSPTVIASMFEGQNYARRNDKAPVAAVLRRAAASMTLLAIGVNVMVFLAVGLFIETFDPTVGDSGPYPTIEQPIILYIAFAVLTLAWFFTNQLGFTRGIKMVRENPAQIAAKNQ